MPVAAVLLVAALVVGYFHVSLDWLGPDRPALGWTVFGLALALLALLMLWQIRNVQLGRPHTRPGIVIPVLMSLSVLVFAAGYFVLTRDPGEFSGLRTRLDALYFTLATLATVGYGDITPHGQSARAVTMLQILYNFVFLTAAATALSQHVRSRAGRHRTRDDEGT
ncbi:potassium channel family protein [Streptomyces sp. S.PNR 29]|uniref:potassium channel family protein n=1 Tax=Streptomyces sp. S.PNR 29 TaxID=2973805 RepID=UPI0025B0E086|nr:potassium channel family protein [Streptomyces sp. S.PNR 29]MDN0198778.1 potassium channel family protein [Streptomyces sp. S.PNR 29]